MLNVISLLSTSENANQSEFKEAIQILKCYNHAKREMTPKSGWNIPFERVAVCANEIESHNGTAQTQIIITADESEFADEIFQN